MLNPRWRKVLRDLWQNKTRTLLVVLSIAVGVFAFGSITGARSILLRDLRARYLAVHPSSATLWSDSFDQELVDAVARMPQVAQAQGRRTIDARALIGADTWYDVQLIVVPDDPATIGIPELRSGVWPPPEKQLLVEQDSLGRLGAQVGQRLHIELPSGDTRDIPIAGLTYDFSLPPPQLAAKAFAYVSLDTLEWLGEPAGFNQLQIIVAEQPDDQAHIWQVAKQVERKIKDSGRDVARIEVPTPLQHPAEQILPTLLLILSIFGVIALLLSAFLITNTIGAVLAQQTRQIGVMKTIGATTRQIMVMYVSMVVIFGVLALLVAVPLGGLAAYGFSYYMADWLNFRLIDGRITVAVVAQEIAAGLLVPVLTSFFPILGAARMTVRAAISTAAPGADGARQSVLDRLLAKVRVLPRPLLLSLRNTFRRKGRLARTLVALVLAGAVFMSVLTVRASLFGSLTSILDARRYDVAVTFTQPYRSERVVQNALQVPGIVAAESWRAVRAQPVRPDGALGDPIEITALPPATQLLSPNIASGRWLLPDDGPALVVSQNFLGSKEPGLKVGDPIVLRVDDEDYRFTIVGVQKEFISKAAAAIGYVPIDYAASQWGAARYGNSLRVALAERSIASQSTSALALDEQLTGQNFAIRSIKTTETDRSAMVERFNLLTSMLGAMAVLIGSVGCLGLMGTMSMNVLERTREIGVMRAIGASNGAIYQVIIGEGVTIGLLAWALATLLSLPISYLMSYNIGMSLLNLPLEYHYTAWAVLAWLLVVLLLAALSSLVPARRAAQLTVREVLTYEG